RPFELEPAGDAARAIGRGKLLRDDALQAEPPGMTEDGVAIAHEMLAEAKARIGRTRRDDLGERRLALAERRLAQIEPIEMEQIEEREGEIALAGLQGIDERGEARDAAIRLDHDLAIDERRLDRQRGCRLGEAAEA